MMNSMLKGITAFLFVGAVCSSTLADTPIPQPEKVIALSPNGSITAISDPVLKTTSIQSSGTKATSWQIPVWSRWLYVANDGKHLVTGYNGSDIGGMDVIPRENDGALVLFTFWREGKKVK